MVTVTIRRQDQPVVRAPDGSEIRELARLNGASMAHCRLPAGAVTIPVRHRTIEEIWYVIAGRGRVWRGTMPDGDVTALASGTSLTIPVGVSFQFRADHDTDLELILATLPPWPGEGEAIPSTGPWEHTVISI